MTPISSAAVPRSLDLYVGTDADDLSAFFDLGRQFVETFHACRAFSPTHADQNRPGPIGVTVWATSKPGPRRSTSGPSPLTNWLDVATPPTASPHD